ncbi:hypothetical protein F2P81_011166 [Scophthalmus maximus]|uniref:Uncharacterized protein n=1 Tax=Scophthalmus maximus TaxID=52904 RepID=A0A6A4SXT9_SCOMX|nr:hypothetical protein F2P81_011166 [Scophthalmus maximus]
MQERDVPLQTFNETQHLAGADTEKQLRVFVTLVALHVLAKSGATKSCSQEKALSCTRRLMEQTLQGLTLPDDFSPDVTQCKDVARSVLTELKQQFGGKVEKWVLLLEDAAMEATVTQCFKKHILEFSKPRNYLSDFVVRVVLTVVIFTTIIVLRLLI